MTNTLRAALATTAFVVAAQASAQTQADSSAKRETAPRRQAAPVLLAVIGGPGIETPTPYVFEGEDGIYQTQKRPMVFELEISKAVLVSVKKHARFEYFVAAQPLVTVGGNVRYHIGPCLRGGDCFGRGVDIYEQRYTSFGAGVTPIGLRMITPLPFSAKFSLSAAGGAVLLNKAIPYAQAKRANFQVTARPAIGIPISRHGTFWAGYELFHMSNGNTSPINPGINAGLVMFGFQRER